MSSLVSYAGSYAGSSAALPAAGVDQCDWYDFECKQKQFTASPVGDALTSTANAVSDAVAKSLHSLGSIWNGIDTPVLTGSGDPAVTPGSTPGTAGLNALLGWAMWIAFGISILSLIWLGVRMATGRRDEGGEHVGRLGVVLVATLLVSGATGIALAIAPATPSTGSAPVAALQNSLWFYMVVVAILGIIAAAARMAWEQRADAGRDLVRSLLTLTIVSGVGLTAVGLLTTAGDQFSVWLLGTSIGCPDLDQPGSTCFGTRMSELLALTSGNPQTPRLGAILVIILGLLAVLAAIAQILLMIVRSGMLVVLAGVLPLSAAATNTETGRGMFRKSAGWLLAFVLYKPAVAIIYATAFRVSETIVRDDGSGLISIITGLTFMILALAAMGALMRLLVPVAAVIGSGSALATGSVTGAGAAPSGAVTRGTLVARGAGPGASGPRPPSGSQTGGPLGSGDPSASRSAGSGAEGSPTAPARSAVTDRPETPPEPSSEVPPDPDAATAAPGAAYPGGPDVEQ